ncbi:hypothetical protein B0H16DRAFT_1527724 [Mycena metata]|uniref:Uncharacterized protein n=1 Tax=Mycena metata TaxID=1033252 RepID=A0AAD7JGM1_9AGAR|nr:hypothetical protein B0H16DRAFT_1527724 [Mycena metata]
MPNLIPIADLLVRDHHASNPNYIHRNWDYICSHCPRRFHPDCRRRIEHQYHLDRQLAHRDIGACRTVSRVGTLFFPIRYPPTTPAGTAVYIQVASTNAYYVIVIDEVDTSYGVSGGSTPTPANCTFGWKSENLAVGTHLLEITAYGASSESQDLQSPWSLEMQNLVSVSVFYPRFSLTDFPLVVAVWTRKLRSPVLVLSMAPAVAVTVVVAVALWEAGVQILPGLIMLIWSRSGPWLVLLSFLCFCKYFWLYITQYDS